MLSRHPESCRFPHGHTRTIEVVVEGQQLDANGMLVVFKALKLALKHMIGRFDHSMAINSSDPLLPELRRLYPEEAIVEFANTEPTTEAFAQAIFEMARVVLASGFHSGEYKIEPGQIRLCRVRVWETPSSWAEFEE